MKHKKILVFLAVLINVGSAFSQRGFQNLKEYDFEPYHFGFLLGVNNMGFSIKPDATTYNSIFPAEDFGGQTGQTALLKSVEPMSTTGFTIGIVGNLRISNHFDLRFIPSLSFGERDLVYNYIVSTPATKDDTITLQKNLKSTLLEFPLMIKYKGDRITNARPYIIGGLKYVMDLSSDANKSTSNASNDLFTVKLKSSDVYAELGAGFDFYFDWFKMSLEAKMSYGLKDVLIHDNTMFTNSITRLNSKIFQLSLTFE